MAGGRVDMGPDEFFPHVYVVGQPQRGGTLTVRVVGDAGRAAYLGASSSPTLRWGPGTVPGLRGGVWLRRPFAVFPLGALPRSGVVTLTVSVPPLPASFRFTLQALVGVQLTGGLVVTVP